MSSILRNMAATLAALVLAACVAFTVVVDEAHADIIQATTNTANPTDVTGTWAPIDATVYLTGATSSGVVSGNTNMTLSANRVDSKSTGTTGTHGLGLTTVSSSSANDGSCTITYKNAGFLDTGERVNVAFDFTLHYNKGKGYAKDVAIKLNSLNWPTGFRAPKGSYPQITCNTHIYKRNSDGSNGRELNCIMFFRVTDLDVVGNSWANTNGYSEGVLFQGTTTEAYGTVGSGGWYNCTYVGKATAAHPYGKNTYTDAGTISVGQYGSNETNKVLRVASSNNWFRAAHSCLERNDTSVSRFGVTPCQFRWRGPSGCRSGFGVMSSQTLYPATTATRITKAVCDSGGTTANAPGIASNPIGCKDTAYFKISVTGMPYVYKNAPKAATLYDILPDCFNPADTKLVKVTRTGYDSNGSIVTSNITSSWSLSRVGTTQQVAISANANGLGLYSISGNLEFIVSTTVKASHQFSTDDNSFSGYNLKYTNEAYFDITPQGNADPPPDEENDEEDEESLTVVGSRTVTFTQTDDGFDPETWISDVSVVGAPADTAYTYESDAPGVATVGSSGVVTPVSPGTCHITVGISAPGYTEDEWEITVTVKAKASATVLAPLQQLLGFAPFADDKADTFSSEKVADDDLLDKVGHAFTSSLAPEKAYAAKDSVRRLPTDYNNQNYVTVDVYLKGYVSPSILTAKLDPDFGTASQGDASVAGAQFSLSYWASWTMSGNATKTRTLTVGDDGYLRLSSGWDLTMDGAYAMPWGVYRLVETKAPDGYDKSETAYMLYVMSDSATKVEVLSDSGQFDNASFGAGGETVSRGVTEPRIWTGSVTVEKRDAQLGGEAQGDAVRAGAKFTVTNKSAASVKVGDKTYASDTIIATITTDESGKATLTGLPYGTYEVEESAAPRGYVLNDATVRTFSIRSDRQSVSLTGSNGIADEVVRGSVAGAKRDADTGSSSQGTGSLAGCVMSLYVASAQAVSVDGVRYATGSVCKTAITDASGAFVFEDIPYGTYIVRETTAPSGYSRNIVWSETVSVRSAAVTAYLATDCVDTALHGGISASIVDADTLRAEPQGDATLAGAVLEVLSANDQVVYISGQSYTKGAVVARMTTDESGNAQTAADALPAGRYTVRVAEASVGYKAMSDSSMVTLSGTNVVAASSLREKVVATPLTVHKIDSITRSSNVRGKMQNCQFGIYLSRDCPHSVVVGGTEYAPGSRILGVVTDEWGLATTPHALPYGSYYWKEEVPPAGYNISNLEYPVYVRQDVDGNAVEKLP